MSLILVSTRILTEMDDFVDFIDKYTKTQLDHDDLICTEESVFAITQSSFVRPAFLKIMKVALFCGRFIPDYRSLATAQDMQSLMNAENKFRVAFSLFAGFLGKLVNQPGLFYNWGSNQAAMIDDVTITIPPFDKCIVYG